MARKFTALALLLGLLLSFAACDPAPDVAGLCLREQDSTMTQQSAWMLEKALNQAGYGCEVTVCDAGMDQSKQLQQVQTLLEAGCAVLVVEPVMTAAAQDLADLAKEADVPLIFIGEKPADAVLDSWSKLCYVGFDPAQPGSLQGKILQDLPDKGDINGDGTICYYVIGGPEDHLDTRLRTTGCVEAMADTGLQTQCLGTSWGDWSRERARDLSAGAIARYGKDIEVLICIDDTTAIGALDAIVDGGRTVGKDIYLLGIGGDQHALALIHSGEMTATVARDLRTQAEAVGELAETLLWGRTPEKVTYVDYVPITGENAETFLAEQKKGDA